MTQAKKFSFKAYAWVQFKQNKPAYYSLWLLAALSLIALLAPILANDQPLYALYKSEHLFPAFTFNNAYEIHDPISGRTERVQIDIAKWKQMQLAAVIWAPIPYSPNRSDILNAGYRQPCGKQFYKGVDSETVPMPLRFRHWFGTNKKGEDVLSGLIHASRISLTIGVLSMLIASVIGLVLGGLAGYFGDERLSTTRGSFWTFIFGLLLAYYYGFHMRSHLLADALGTSGLALGGQLLISLTIAMVMGAIFYFLGKWVGKRPFLDRQVSIPVDSFISRTIEILLSIPTFVLILSIAAIAKPSILNLMLIIGLTRWTGIARFTRAEFLRIRNLEYIQAGQALGYSEMRIIFRHALPNGMATALVAIAFGIASSILTESSLSFLGIGVPPDVVTWGSLLSSGRENFNAWFLVIFPGLAIFLTVTIYNLLGEGLRDALDPRLKR